MCTDRPQVVPPMRGDRKPNEKGLVILTTIEERGEILNLTEDYAGQDVISEDRLFVNIMDTVGGSDVAHMPNKTFDEQCLRGEALGKLHKKWGRSVRSIVKFFERMTERIVEKDDRSLNDNFYYVSHSYIKQTVVVYHDDRGRPKYSTGTIGMTLQLQYMGSITKVEEQLRHFKVIMESFTSKYDNLKVEIFLAMELDDYNLK